MFDTQVFESFLYIAAIAAAFIGYGVWAGLRDGDRESSCEPAGTSKLVLATAHNGSPPDLKLKE